MRKNLFNSFACLTICSSVAFSQPVLTATGINPVIGDVLTIKHCNYVSPGNSGSGQNWNLSGITATNTTNYTVGTVGSAPNSSSFAAASNMQANNGSDYYFFNTSSTAFQNSGVIGPYIIVFTDNEDLMRFPFNMSNNYTDTWAAGFTSNSISWARTGTSVATYDGYGTLVLPTGTFNNVARVHFVQTYKDVSSLGAIVNYSNDQYLWFVNGHHQAIAGVFSVDFNSSSTALGSYYSNVATLPTFITEQENDISNVVSFPNPASDVLNFNLKNGVRIHSISLYKSNGSLVYSGKNENINENTISINVEELSNGIYIAQLTAVDGSIGKKVISIRK